MSERARSERLGRRRRPAAFLFVAALCLTSIANGSSVKGRPLASFLEDLRRQGLNIIYSSTLVDPSMTVETEPRAGTPREVLQEVLAPHGLTVREESTSLIVVPSPSERSGGIRVLIAGAPPSTSIAVRVDSQPPIRGTPGQALRIPGLAPGTHTLVVEAEDFIPIRLEGLIIYEGEIRSVEVTLTPAVEVLEALTVTPNRHRLADEQPHGSYSLSAAQAQRLPEVAPDPFWAAKTLPGTSHSDTAAAFHVRGGKQDETLVLLDGIELYEPFHLKDLLPVFSIVDRSAVAAVDLSTGGFSARYGGRMSGVMEISTLTSFSSDPTSVRASTTDSGVVTSGLLRGVRLHYLAAIRAWYPDDVLRAAGFLEQPVLTDYYDALAKVIHQWSDRTTVAAGGLGAYDDARYVSADDAPERNVVAEDSTLQGWIAAETVWSPALASRTAVSAGEIRRDRRGGAVRPDAAVTIADRRAFSFAAIKQDWSLDLGDRHMVSWGADLKSQRAAYDFHSRIEGAPVDGRNLDIVLQPQGEAWAGYLSDRARLGRSLIVEVGVRLDQGFGAGEAQVSPRVSLLYARGDRMRVRAAWGRYAQSQQLNELPVADGVVDFSPPEQATQWLVSVERRFPLVRGRLEVYDKTIESPHAYYENLFDELDLFPESRADRVRVEPDRAGARGIELVLESESARRYAWWLSYALSEVNDTIDDREVPRSWDQRHAFSFGANAKLPRDWDVSLTGTYSSGRPGTEMRAIRTADGDIALVPGPRNATLRPSYHRLDARVTKRFSLRHGSLVLAAELLNVTGRSNVCCISGFTVEEGVNGNLTVHADERIYPRLVPSLSLRWDF
ncbi:MAG: TonB-dependent receptor domain-containing protein [Thermoanaerobaculia bacterium]